MIDGVFAFALYAFVLYAFALYDPRNRSLHVDMIGIRPLYWSMGYGRKRNRYGRKRNRYGRKRNHREPRVCQRSQSHPVVPGVRTRGPVPAEA